MRPGEGLFSLLLTHHEDGAVGVPDGGVGDAAHKRPPYPAMTPAVYHHQAHAQALGRAEDLLVRVPLLRWGSATLPPFEPICSACSLRKVSASLSAPPMRDSLTSSG